MTAGFPAPTHSRPVPSTASAQMYFSCGSKKTRAGVLPSITYTLPSGDVAANTRAPDTATANTFTSGAGPQCAVGPLGQTPYLRWRGSEAIGQRRARRERAAQADVDAVGRPLQ